MGDVFGDGGTTFIGTDRVESVTERNQRIGKVQSRKANAFREHLLSTPSQIADGIAGTLRMFEVS